MTSPLIVEWMGPSLNRVYAGVHWSQRDEWANDGHFAVIAAVRKAKIKPIDHPVHLTFTPMIKGRRYDPSNYALSAKIIEDGLVREGIIKGDSLKYIWRFSIDAPIHTKQQSYMVVKLEEVMT